MSEQPEVFLQYVVPGRPVTWARLRVHAKQHYVSGDQKAAKRAHALAALAAFRGRRASWDLAGAFEVHVRGYWPDAGVGDCDRLASLALDALEGVTYKADRQVRRIVSEVAVDRENPRVEVTVMRMSADTVAKRAKARKAKAA